MLTEFRWFSNEKRLICERGYARCHLFGAEKTRRVFHAGLNGVRRGPIRAWAYLPCRSERTLWVVALAVASTLVPAWVRIWARVRLEVSAAKSASRIELWLLVTFS